MPEKLSTCSQDILDVEAMLAAGLRYRIFQVFISLRSVLADRRTGTYTLRKGKILEVILVHGESSEKLEL